MRRGYWGCVGVIVCDSKDMRAKRQVVEGVISQIKLFLFNIYKPLVYRIIGGYNIYHLTIPRSLCICHHNSVYGIVPSQPL